MSESRSQKSGGPSQERWGITENVVNRHTLNGALDGECGPGGKCGPGGEKKIPRNKNKSAQF